jgi:4-amino-4-deoxy-L-arabinose transferase-like glycosyltransferase
VDSSVSTSKVRIRTSEIIFWSVAFLSLFWALGNRGLWASEDRWAEVTREMFLSGNFFHPTINGEPYFDKPLLTYWFIALVSALTGKLNEWTVRLPSAIAGLMALWATVFVGRRLWSEEVGRTSGWILLTTFGFLFWSRSGTADMENLATIILSIAWYWTWRGRQNFLTYLVFYLICFIGAQTKGLTAVAVPMVALLPDVLRERRWRALLKPSHAMALIIGFALYLAPFIYANLTQGAYQETGLALVFRENIQRYFHPFDHIEPFYVYFYYLPVFFLPWAPLLLVALFRTTASIKNLDDKTRWLVEAVLLIFLLFTVSGSRRSYYILPILPFCALMIGVYLKTADKEMWKRLGLGLQKGLFALIVLIELLSPAICFFLQKRIDFVVPEDIKLAALMVGLFALSPWIIERWRLDLLVNVTGINQKAASLVATAAILMGGLFCWQQARFEVYRTKKPFAREIKNQIADILPPDIAFYRKIETTVLFYLDVPGFVRVVNSPEAVTSFLRSGKDTKVLISTRRKLKDLFRELPAGTLGQPSVSEKIYPWEKNSKKKLVAWKIKREGG